MNARLTWSLLMLFAACPAVEGAAPFRASIDGITRVTVRPEQCAPVDFDVMLTARWTDPACSSEVAVDLRLQAPSGSPVDVPAYLEHGLSGRPSEWRVRFSPEESGAYSGSLVIRQDGRDEATAPVRFEVAPSGRRGFLHPDGPWIFRFDNGEPFRGIGENIAWESRSNDDSRYFRALNENPRYNYGTMFGKLAASGGNFVRAWMCPWNLPLEWNHVVDTDRYSDDTGRFNRSAIHRMDQVVRLARESGVYLMLTLDTGGALLGGDWAINPYNARNGGPAATPVDFFTNPAARARYKDRLRYIVARWGYSPHIAAWELFNEVDNAMYGQTPERIPDSVVTAWHAEMSAYLKRIDPAHRPVTTSVSHRDVAGLDAIPTIDFNQRHIYRSTHDIPSVLRRYVRSTGKPYVIGEFSREWDWSRNFDDFAADMDGDYRRGLWLGLFSPTPILPMSWWWEYFDSRNQWPVFGRVRRISDWMLRAGGGHFEEEQARWTGSDCQALGVRCGRTVFLLVDNGAGTARSGRLGLPPAPPEGWSLRVYHADTGGLDNLASTGASLSLSVPARSDVVVILEPGKGGGS